MSKLSKRLQIIANIVTGKIVCDVGCDHGKLSNYLLESNIVDKVIVSDISLPSLQKAIDLLSDKSDRFESICCDGLIGYKDKNIDQCIISGMGGDEIIQIISNSPIDIESFILSPQHNNINVKKYMLSLGYEINYDIIILDKGKFYNIFRCQKSDKITYPSEFDLVIGKDNYTDSNSDIEKFVEYEIKKINTILTNNNVNNKELIAYFEHLKDYNKRK